MHRLVMARLDSAMTPEQVVDAFVAQYGVAVMMAPPKTGFNWTAYIMPFVGLGLGLALVVGLMRRWIRASPRSPELVDLPVPGPRSPVPDTELDRLKRELEHFEA
jgi:cytochrome c-type biogenesis protein CcmH/NrfF